MNFCFHFSDQRLRVLVGPVEGSDKKKGVLREIAIKWTNRLIKGFSLADVSTILQEHGGLLEDELANLNGDIATFANLVADIPHALNDGFSDLTEAIRAETSPSSSLEGSVGSRSDNQSMGQNPANDSGEDPADDSNEDPADDSDEDLADDSEDY
jgi:hypothetical protein